MQKLACMALSVMLLLALSPVLVLPEMDRLNGQKASYELSDLVPLARLTADPNPGSEPENPETCEL